MLLIKYLGKIQDPKDLITKEYVENSYRTASAQDVIDAGKLSKSGGNLSGNLNFTGDEFYFQHKSNTVWYCSETVIIFGDVGRNRVVQIMGHNARLQYAGTGDTAYHDIAFTDDLNGKADKPTVKSTMDSVAAVNTIYNLGVQSAVPVVLPSNAPVMSQVQVIFYNGATAATLSITGTMLDCDYAPSANSRSEINALWDGTYWAVLTNEQALPEVVA